MQNKRIVVYRRHHQNGLKYVSLGCCVMVACSHPFQREREREREETAEEVDQCKLCHFDIFWDPSTQPITRLTSLFCFLHSGEKNMHWIKQVLQLLCCDFWFLTWQQRFRICVVPFMWSKLSWQSFLN